MVERDKHGRLKPGSVLNETGKRGPLAKALIQETAVELVKQKVTTPDGDVEQLRALIQVQIDKGMGGDTKATELVMKLCGWSPTQTLASDPDNPIVPQIIFRNCEPPKANTKRADG